MEFSKIIEKSRQIRRAYDNLNYQEKYKTWGVSEYAQGLVGDVGDLMKLIMAKKGLRFADSDIDEKIKQELADCLWSIIVIADELKIDLQKEFLTVTEKLEEKISNRSIIKKNKIKRSK